MSATEPPYPFEVVVPGGTDVNDELQAEDEETVARDEAESAAVVDALNDPANAEILESFKPKATGAEEESAAD